MTVSGCVVYLLILSVVHSSNQPVFRTLFFIKIMGLKQMNKANVVLDALTYKDHQIILAIICWLENCHTRVEFNLVVETALIPLLGCSGVFYVDFESNENTPQLLDSIRPPNLCWHQWDDFLIAAMRTHAAANDAANNRSPSLIVDTHYPNGMSHYQINDHCRMMVLHDDPKQTLAVCFCHMNTMNPSYSQRHIELMNLLRPILLQTIKTILFREDSRKQQQIMDRRSSYVEPLAVVSDEGILVYKNNVYDRTVSQGNCTFLSTVFSQANIIKFRKIESCCLLSQLGRRLYEITLMLANEGVNENTRLYLLRFSRITNKAGKIFNQLNRAGLTKRELEIATLIYQGTNTRDISETINLSYHTVRNHIKSIYSKLGVSTRSEMLVWGG